ncbi:uncharacterized protein EI90DRAFT_1306678 [Cantharellus anzutake]|uniref:uncharacterized protein n=1 Tax=Cantharellus anzutake TaxID=1750568 RepID=UPI0019056FF6|nr:uncharacterized protein EI90DRAFT_1306678 [Cantharellus anzutake]KAF8342147.1 hypothetical protein EI90DRAFT_1306678 [Cantharellus anzutake]
MSFSQSDVLNAILTWGDWQTRLPDTKLPASLRRADARAFSNKLVDTCTRAQALRAADTNLRINIERLDRVKVSLVLSRYRTLSLLHHVLSNTNPDGVFRWEMPRYGEIKPVRGWTSPWALRQDSQLLIGVWIHGFGNWLDLGMSMRIKFY